MQSSENGTSSDGLTILFAEDDPFSRELIGARLTAEGYRVIEASAADEALPFLNGRSIDVLLTDISMPGTLDGWALAERARIVHPHIAVVYLSAGPGEAARQVGGSLYLRKPLHPEAVVAAIAELVSRRMPGGQAAD